MVPESSLPQLESLAQTAVSVHDWLTLGQVSEFWLWGKFRKWISGIYQVGNSPNLESVFRCQMPKKNNKCQLFSAVRPGYQERLEESHFPNSSRSSQISFHLSDIHYFLINAFTLGCGREHGYSQSAKHMVILLLQPPIAGHCQRFPYQSDICSSSACAPLEALSWEYSNIYHFPI